MKIHELNQQYQKIRKLIDSTSASTSSDLELQGHWGKYLCILVAGFLENAISAVYIELTKNAASPLVASYAANRLKTINNPKSSKFVEVACSFKKSWGAELETYFAENDEVKNAIDSIMNTRHLVAHGKNTSISVGRVSLYLDESVKAIEFIEKQCSIT